MTRAATDADFNSSTREITVKLDVFFDGADAPPMTITKNNYLMDIDLLNESGVDSANPLNAISSDEFSFRLFNDAGLFNPSNTSGMLYGKIKTGVLIIPYIKPVVDDAEIDWIKMGEYFVTDWKATVTGTVADVTANDTLYDAFSRPTPTIPIIEDVSFHDFFQEYFKALGYPDKVDIDESLKVKVPYAYSMDTIVGTLQEMSQGAMAMCICRKDGVICVESLTKPKDIRAVLTDENQIISANIQQSAIKAYSGVELTYLHGQLTDQIELLKLQDVTLQGGITTLDKIAFKQTPVRVVSYCSVQTPKNAYIRNYTATPWNITMTAINESGDAATGAIIVNGFAVNFVENYLVDSGDKLLKVRNEFIQQKSYADNYKLLLNRFVSNEIPTLTLSIRGNPLLNIGDKVNVVSRKYNLDYTGIIQRLKYRYDGGLSCDMTLLNAAILEV